MKTNTIKLVLKSVQTLAQTYLQINLYTMNFFPKIGTFLMFPQFKTQSSFSQHFFLTIEIHLTVA